MAKNLLIIESPNNIETIGKFLGADWKIMATVGHTRDLAKINGFNPETLEPKWVGSPLPPNHGPMDSPKKEIISVIQPEAYIADKIYIQPKNTVGRSNGLPCYYR